MDPVSGKFIVEGVTSLFSSLFGFIDDLHTSDDEKLKAKHKLMGLQGSMLDRILSYEQRALEIKAGIITAEAQGESWIQRNWRPLTMLSFVGAVLGYWFGFTPDTLPPDAVDNMFTLVQIGLGGYVVGRSAEKITKSVSGQGLVENFKQKFKD